MRRRLVLLLGSTALLVVAVGWPNRAHLAAFPDIIGAYSAKEYCSCRYVSGNPADYCQVYIQQYIPIDLLHDEPATRTVTARGLGRTHSASWLGPREGCRLLAEGENPPMP
ncbi:amidase [Azotobacter salinestris]|uniref:amidase n=1 Tax=Azotobacter salinestris TaxID=69964 RepID=UPI001266BC83